MKKLSVFLAVFCLFLFGVSCNSAKKQSSKPSFAAKVYEDESPWGSVINFVDSDFCVIGLACCNYKYDSKTNVLTVTTFAVMGSETMTYVYDAATDTLKSTDGSVLKYIRQLTKDEIDTANGIKQSMLAQ